MKRKALLAAAAILISGSTAFAAEWSPPTLVTKGGQFDVALGPGNKIHLISSQYVQMGADGKVIATEKVGDGRQGPLDFWPAIAVGPDGAVHTVTRHGGEWNSGHDIRYKRRSPEGKWDLDLMVSKPSPRNYTVGAAVTSDGRVHLAHSTHPPGVNMTSYIECYEVADGEVKHLGRIKGRYMRADDGFRMCAWGRFLHIASGNPWPGGKVSYLLGVSGGKLPKRKGVHRAGSGRRGCPWVYPGKAGFVHLTYGAKESVWYNKYTYYGRKAFPKDILLAEGLGKWQLTAGLSVVAASDDGKHVVAVILRSDGTKEIVNAQLLWRHSPNRGLQWHPLKETAFHTDAGEGRRRPGLVAIGSRFHLFFYSRAGIQMSVLDLGEENAGEKPKRR